MFRAIMIKEFLDNLLNLRFTVGLLVTVLLTVASVMFHAQSHSQKMQDYHTDNRLQQENIEKFGSTTSFFNESPLFQPEPLSLVATGLSTDSDMTFDGNFVPRMFPFIDLVFVVSVILSMLGLLFSYDSICGEKENGTLKLVCSNTLSRATILLGKWVGGTASLLVPFLIAILFASIYIELDPGVMWQSTDWAAFGALTVVSMAFISLFYLVGMMVSALSKSSSVSILKAVLLWVLLVLVVPNLGPYVSTELYPIPSLVRITKEYNKLTSDFQNKTGIMKKINELRAELDAKYEREYGDLFREYKAIPRGHVLDRTGMEAPDSDLKEMGLTYRRESRNINNQVLAPIRAGLVKTREQMKLELERQTKVAGNIAAISPYADFLYVAADIAGTGMDAKKNKEHALKEFGEASGKFHAEKMAEKDRKKISDFKNMKNDPFDLSGRPRFSYEEQPLRHRLTATLPYLGVILLYGVLFFAIAFVGFVRYDVR